MRMSDLLAAPRRFAAPALLTAIAALAGCTVIPPSDPARGQQAYSPPPPPATYPAAAPATTPPYPPVAQYPAPPTSPPASTSESPLAYAGLGQTVNVGGPRVTPLDVLEDSRCAINARCVWAGQVRLRVRIESGRGGTIELTSGKPATVADGTLELVEVRPDKVAGGKHGGAIPTSAYRFGFRFMGGY